MDLVKTPLLQKLPALDAVSQNPYLPTLKILGLLLVETHNFPFLGLIINIWDIHFMSGSIIITDLHQLPFYQ